MLAFVGVDVIVVIDGCGDDDDDDDDDDVDNDGSNTIHMIRRISYLLFRNLHIGGRMTFPFLHQFSVPFEFEYLFRVLIDNSFQHTNNLVYKQYLAVLSSYMMQKF